MDNNWLDLHFGFVEISNGRREPLGRVWQIERRVERFSGFFWIKESAALRVMCRACILCCCFALCCRVLCCFRAVSQWRCDWQSGSQEPPSVTSSAAYSSLSFLPCSTLLTVINAANTRGRPLYSDERTRSGIAIIYKPARAHRPLPSLFFQSAMKSINSQGIDFLHCSIKTYVVILFLRFIIRDPILLYN